MAYDIVYWYLVIGFLVAAFLVCYDIIKNKIIWYPELIPAVAIAILIWPLIMVAMWYHGFNDQE